MAKKQSGNKASSLAGKLLAECKDAPKYILISRRDLKTLCASVLSQDETKGKRLKNARRAYNALRREAYVSRAR